MILTCQVVCPLGCHAFYEDVQEKQYFEVLAKLVRDAKDVPLFASMRSNWPYAGKVLDWTASASLVLKDHLPHILLCKRHEPKELNQQVHKTNHCTIYGNIPGIVFNLFSRLYTV